LFICQVSADSVLRQPFCSVCFFLPLKKSANYWASFILKNISLVRAALPQEYWIEKLDLNRGNGPARQVLSLIQREL